MSADNFIGVWSCKDSLGRDSRWYVAHGMMPEVETVAHEIKWKIEAERRSDGYPTRESALVAAHDLLKKEQENYNCPVVEYGVLEL